MTLQDAIYEAIRTEPPLYLSDDEVALLADRLAALGVGTLDAAWAEAEAALPKGWVLEAHRRPDVARAEAWNFNGGIETGYAKAEADTPAAALTALAAKLRADR